MKRIWRQQYILWESIWVCRFPKHFISTALAFFLSRPCSKSLRVFSNLIVGPVIKKRWAWYKNTKTTQTCLMRGMFTILAEATAANGTKRWKKNDNYTDSELILHNFHNVAPEALESLPLLLPKVFSNLIWIYFFSL